MQNVSLRTAGTSSQVKFSSNGLWFLFIVFVMTLLLYGGLYFWKNQLESEIQAVKDAYFSQYAKLKGDDTKEVIDFNNRTIVAKSLLSDDRNLQDSLVEIEKLMIDGVFLTSFEYEYDGKSETVSLVGTSNNFNAVAKQILSFKSSEYFSGVTGGKSKINANTGLIDFEVNMSFKK